MRLALHASESTFISCDGYFYFVNEIAVPLGNQAVDPRRSASSQYRQAAGAVAPALSGACAAF